MSIKMEGLSSMLALLTKTNNFGLITREPQTNTCWGPFHKIPDQHSSKPLSESSKSIKPGVREAVTAKRKLRRRDNQVQCTTLDGVLERERARGKIQGHLSPVVNSNISIVVHEFWQMHPANVSGCQEGTLGGIQGHSILSMQLFHKCQGIPS